ncbi:TonB-dependent receptor [Novosphingobium bradum]|uniref:TonB-dependent receptor n=1 Tax=Novosphingobium bradum TaxID=1737444 RepID=A0ABV7IM49_9SPHN
MISKIAKAHLLASGCLVGLAAFAPGVAQAAAAPDGSASSSGEIIVTAQRRAEKQQDVPISITAMSADTLQKANIVNIRDVQNIAPSFRVSSTGVFMQLSIRGITSTALGPGIENNIAVYVDGFYQPISTSLGGDLVNVANVQILKGPQGTLYGRNATGGALLVTTREPSADKVIFDADAGYGNLNDVRLRAYAGVPLGNGLSFGVGGYYRSNDGYIKDVDGSNAAPYSNWEVRTKLKYEPSADVSLTLGYNHMWKDDGSTYAYGFYKNQSLAGVVPIPPIGPLRTDQPDTSSVDTPPINSSRLDEFTGKLSWDTGFGKLNSYTSYANELFHVDVDFDGTKVPLQRFDARWYRKTWTQALDFQAKPADNLDLTVGGMYYHDKSSQDAPFYSFGVMRARGFTTQRTEGLAGYVDATWQAVPNLYLTAGVRYSRDKRSIESFNRLVSPATVVVPLTRASFDSWTPRFTVRYEFQPDMSVYASYSRGFKSGLFNSTGSPATMTTPVRPEKNDAYEVGLKAASHGIYFDAAAYYYDYKDLQVNAVQIDPATQRTLTSLTNAATARIWGFEASVSAPLTEQFNVRAAAAYTHARYRNFANANPIVEILPGVNGSVTGGQNWSGRRISRAPDWTFNIGADYTIPVGEGSVVVAANGAYSSKYAPTSEGFDLTTGAVYEQKGYFQANATIDYHLPGDHLTIGAWVNNLTDKRYAILFTAEGLGSKKVLSTPRTFGVKLGYKY